MKNFTKKLNKKTVGIGAAALIALGLGCGTAYYVNYNNNQSEPASADHASEKVWLQYGTLKYDLRGPSGRIYRAGTKVVRDIYKESKPAISIPSRPFYLTLIIGGKPGMQGIQDAGGGLVNEKYVNMDDWYLTDYPSDSTTLVSNVTNNPDMTSSDYHPVDNSNPDVASVNRDKLKSVFADFMTSINFSKINSKDREVVKDINERQSKAMGMNTTQEEVDQLTEYLQNVIDMYKKTGHLTGAYDPAKGSINGTEDNSDANKPSDNSTGNNGSGSVADDPTSTNVASPRTVRLRKASYRYTSKGKRVSKKLLKKGSYVKINGKTYHIKGKTYYRIAKNRYIRKVNVAR